MSATTPTIPTIAMTAVSWDLQRAVAVVAIALTVAALAVTIATGRRPRPIRLGFDVARLAASVLGVVVMAVSVGFSVAVGWILLALGAGLLVGTGQGWFTRIDWHDDRAVASRTTTGIAIWGVGLLVMQGAGVLARTGGVRLGQTISWFGIGTLVGALIGRRTRVTEARSNARARVAAGTTLAALVVLAIGAGQGGDARAQEETDWVLVDAEVNPASEADPLNWDVTTTIEGMSVVMSFGPDDPSGAEGVFTAAWNPPPDRLTPGATVTIPITVSGRNTGNLETQYFFGLDVVMLVDGTWNNQGVGAGAHCAQTTVISGEYVCSEPTTNTGEVFTTVPSFGESFSVGLTALNCGSACQVTWSYARAPATDVTEPAIVSPDPAAEPVPATAPPPSAVPSPGVDATQPERDATATVGLPPAADTTDDIDSNEAIAQSIGGLIAAVAVGIISAAEAGVLISSILGQGPLTTGEAMVEIDRVFTPLPPPEPEVTQQIPPPPPAAPPPLPPPPAAASVEPGATSEPEERASARSEDPCAPLEARYRDSLRRWTHVQRQIQALENEYWALNEYVETGAEAAFWGAATYLATLGLDTYRGPGAASGAVDAMVSSFEQSLCRSVASQALQAAAMGQGFDTEQVAEKALSDAAGTGSAAHGDPGQGAFGAFAKQSITGLSTRLASSGLLRSLKAAVESGTLDAAGAAHLERSIADSYARDIGPLVGVIFKGWEVWKKNEEWAAGAHARARIRNHMVDIDARINELEFDRDEIDIERKVDRQQLDRCREEHA